jgi:release factor glutamine methyltransferase
MAEPHAAPAWTLHKLLEWTAGFLKEKGAESPRLEAEILLAHTLKCKRIELYTRSDEPAEDSARTAYRELIRRRVDGCPVAYLVGYREFYKLTFEVSPDVLVPRPDTETLVMECLRLAKKLPDARILDIGTGSGAIAVSVAHQLKTARVTATDVSPAALTVSRRNAGKHGVADRMRFLEGDLFAPVPAGERFHFVVSNPPYIDPAEWDKLPRDVRDFEPRLALDGGAGGLAVLDRLIAGAGPFLEPDGWLMIEIGADQGDAARERLAAVGGFADVAVLPDAAGRPRVLQGRRRP